MISYLTSLKVPWIIALPVGLILDVIIAVVFTDFVRSILELL